MLPLEPRDKREVCPLHGWVGRRAFLRDRHDLCEAPAELIVEEEDEDVVDVEVESVPEIEEAEPPPSPRVRPPSPRRRGIPPKKTVAVRRITRVELDVGRAELRVLGADGPYERPKMRGDCQWCPVCQLVRDGKSSGLDGVALRTLDHDLIHRSDREEGRVGSSLQLSGENRVSNAVEFVAEREHDELRLSSSGKQLREVEARNVANRDLPQAAGQKQEEYEAAPAPQLGRLACGHRIAEVVMHSRPCVFAACKHSLYLDISETGSIILNFPHLEPGEMPADQSCALDLAERGGMTLEQIATVTNLTRERIRQVELKALLRRARPAAIALGIRSEDAAAAGSRRNVGPGQDLVETGIDGELPSDVATLLAGK